jgi:hypothetical protein
VVLAGCALRFVFRGGDPKNFFVEVGHVSARRSRADQAAPRRIENRRFSRAEHGHVQVRMMADVAELSFGLDDVPLERRTTLGVLVA